MESKIQKYKLIRDNTEFESFRVESSYDVENFIKPIYGDQINVVEMAFAIFLDYSLNCLGYAKISQGSNYSTIMCTKLIAKYAIDSLCANVVVVHNHPTGNVKPSKADCEITKKIQESLSLFSIKLADHIIISKNNSYSFLGENDL